MNASELIANNIPTFARHETFHPRYGWLHKAITSAERDPEIFTKPTATVELGVGKNMVEAIRYWGQAFKLLREATNPTRPRLPWLVPSPLGSAMFSSNGWDPYVEAPGTLWVLHWWLLTPRTKVPVWWLTFNGFSAAQFTDALLTSYVQSILGMTSDWTDVMESSVKKDVDCLVRMYSPRKGDTSNDDAIDCPFRELGLIEPVPGEARTYRFVVGPKPGLPDPVLAYAAADFMARTATASTITLARLSHEVGSPGRAFRLTETAIYESLLRYAGLNRRLRLTEIAGVKQLVVDNLDRDSPIQILQDYYKRETGSRYRYRSAAEEAHAAPPVKGKARSIRGLTAQLEEAVHEDPAVRRKVQRMVRRIEERVRP